jgi:hypothetical protein
MTGFRRRLALSVLLFCCVLTVASAPQAAERYLVLPMEVETDRGAANGDATLLRVMPAYNWKVNDDWQVVNLDLVLLANAPGGRPGSPSNPEPIPGGRARGLSDWLHASFFSPITDKNTVIGVGFLASVPTATDPALGSGKWAIGPALRFGWSGGNWRVGAFGGQRWSFAGKSDRADIDQLMVRATILYDPPGRWFLVSAPIITANWNSDREDRWLVPLGGGIGRKFDLSGSELRTSIQFYGNVARPEGAPDWSARLAVTAVIPFGG